MSFKISSTRQAVIRGPSFIGWGKRPVLTPSHHVDLLTGIRDGYLELPKICASLKKPVCGSLLIVNHLRLPKENTG